VVSRTPAAVDAEIAHRAASQHGVVSRGQLFDDGIGAGLVDYRLKVGRLHRVHSGVYAVGFPPRSSLALATAAVLACGPGAVLSHRSAAALWELDSSWFGPVEVTARCKRCHRGVIVHRSRTLSPSDVTSRCAIPVTGVARTLVDLADVVDDLALARAVNQALLRRRVGVDELAIALSKSSGRRAATRLRPFIQRADAPTRSVFEDAFLAFVQRHGLPRPPGQPARGRL
jgi:predicted transcriptional regulator of viral defense system